MIKKSIFLGVGVAAILALPTGLLGVKTNANPAPQRFAQAGAEEPTDFCVALQEVTTGATEIRKRIENRVVGQGNWNTDFLVPTGQEFSYFVAILTPENNGSYEFNPNLRFPDNSRESLFNARADLRANETYSIPFQSSSGRVPAVVNTRVGGVNGNVYTISVVGCQ